MNLREELQQKCSKKVTEYLKRKKKYRPQIVLLTGSYGRGEPTIYSDVDIIFVSEKLPKNFISRIGALMENDGSTPVIEPLGYTMTEFLRMIKNKNPFIMDAIRTGKVLMGKQLLTQLLND